MIINPFLNTFKINHSFLLDGVYGYFTVPNASIINLVNLGNNFTFFALVKITTLGINQSIISNQINSNGLRTFMFDIMTDNTIRIRSYTSVFTVMNASGTVSLGWNLIGCAIDKTTQTNSKIYINNNISPTTDNTLGSTFNVNGGDFNFGVWNSISLANPFNGNYQMMGIVNRKVELVEWQEFYNLGKLKNPLTIFGADLKMNLNADNSGNTAQFTITDAVNSISANSVNLEDADKTTTTAY